MRRVLALALLCVSGSAFARPDADPDRVIEEKLRNVLAHVDDLEKVTASVNAGVVRLEGTTASVEARDKAEQLAAKMDGVLYVDNDIEETAEVVERVSPALERLQSLGKTLAARAPLYGVALAVIVVFLMLGRAISHSERLLAPFVRHRMMRGIARQLLAATVVVIGVVAALELLEATALVGAVLGAAGVAGIAVGFAFRDIVENYLASVLLGLRRPFEPNDLVLVGSHEGKVIRLTTRETILMSLDGNHVRLPNAQVFKSVIVNFSRNPLRRLSFQAGIGVTENLTDAQRVGVEALRGTPGVVADPGPFTRIEALAESTVTVELFAWVDQREADWYKVRSEAVRRVKAALDAAGISMPVPTYRLEAEARERPAERRREELAQAAHEVAPDDVLDRQIRDDAAREPEENLLENDAPGDVSRDS